MSWLARLRNAVRTNRLSDEIDREIAFHLAERADELTGAGMAPDDAAREARRRFGNYGVLKERTRERDLILWLDTVAADLRYALRALRAAPAFSVVAVASLALGIGANTAIFTLINAVMFQALPVRHPSELVVVTRDDRVLTYPMWDALRQRQSVFSSAFAYASTRVDLADGGEARRVPVGLVSGDVFTTLGVGMALGRPLRDADDHAGCTPVAVVSHRFWQTELGGRSSAIGGTITIDRHPVRVVGVADPSFFGIEIGYHVPVWVPSCTEATLRGDAEAGLNSHMGRMVIGRMKPGVTLAQVRAHLRALRPAILDATAQYSAPRNGILMGAAEYRKTTFDAASFTNGDPALRLTYGSALIALMGAVVVVLLIACANVANLLLARATAREREIAVRLAIGATRGRLVRQLLTESGLLAVLGAAGGVTLALWGSRFLIYLLASSPQAISLDLTPDWHVVAFTTALAVATGLLFGLAPAWRAGRVRAGMSLKPLGRGVIEGHSRFRIGKAIVVAQIALSLVSVTGAALLLGSWLRLASVDPGYDRDRVLLVSADMASATTPAERVASQRRILERLRAVPGVTGVGAAAYTPLSSSWNTVLHLPGSQRNDAIVRMNEVSDGYFGAIGTRLLGGRDFDRRDTPQSPAVAIVSETLARELLGGSRALGQRVRLGSPPGEPVEVVGIVADSRQSSLQEPSDRMVWLPLGRDTAADASISFAIRTAGPPVALVASVKVALAEIDPRISFSLTTMARRLDGSIRVPRTLGVLAACFGGLALVLAALGLYGVMAYTVARRRGEIGIRIALGAARTRVVRLILGDAARLVVAGVAVGVALSLAAGRAVASLLYGIEPNDPLTLAAAAIGLGVVAIAAGAVPARRAARLDPMSAIRQD